MSVVFLLLLAACPRPAPVDSAPQDVAGEGLFLHGCPVEGAAFARTLTDVAERPWGEEALAQPGDVLLASSRAAFVIQAPEDPRTYYHYGGMPIDAVAVEGCAQAGPERLEELGFVVGRLDLADFPMSSLHQVRGEEVTVVSDGSDGGPAVVEVRATDDRFWLVELTLVRDVYVGGGRKELGPLYGLDLTLRYTLQPDSDVLEVEVVLDGEVAEDGFLLGALAFPSDSTEVHAFSTGELSVGGFGLDLGVPWLAMGSDEGSLAVAMPEAATAYTEVAGVRALLDANQAVAPLQVGGDGEPPVVPFLLGVGATDAASAGRTLEPWLGGAWTDLEGTVQGPEGPVGGAEVELQAEVGGSWQVLDRLVADATGAWGGRVVDPGVPTRLVVRADGRDEVVDEAPGGEVAMGPARAVVVDVRDEAGTALPARVELEREDGTRVVRHVLPGESVPLAPGRWSAWVSRGYAYTIAETTVDTEAGDARLEVRLDRVVDTEGWVSMDSHVHAEASADSDTLASERVRSAAAAGLDLLVSTDHEAILDLQPAVDAAGLSDTLAYALGSEVTATVPEHVNAWPFPVSDDPRGDPVRWYELGFPDLYAAIRARGARVVQLNHSRVNGECGILCVLDWDRLSEAPTLADPEALGLPAGTEIWSWDFDSFEVMNGLRSPLWDPADSRHTGALYDWLAFHNLGHRVTGVAVTDVHGLEIPGSPRTFVRAASADADLVADGVLAGGAVLSAGAFARVDVGGAGPGELGVGDHVSLRVEAIPAVDVRTVWVLVDCDRVAVLDATDPGGVVKLEAEVPLPEGVDSYVVTLGFGADAMPRGFEDYPAATVPRFLTNPVFVDGDGDGAWTPPGPKTCDLAP